MDARIWLSELQFSDGTNIRLNKNDIVVLVGPNNSGKSASLKEASEQIKQKNNRGKVIKNIEIEQEGELTDLFSLLNLQSIKEFTSNPGAYYKGLGYHLYEPHLSSYWSSYKTGIKELFPIFTNLLNTEQRLKAANPAVNIKLTTEPIQHPIHFLQKYDHVEKKFNGYFRQAFGTDLIVHRGAGSIVPLYVGESPTIKPGEDRVSEGYLRDLEELDLLDQQGDGMRSFVGVLLNAFVSNQSILFIDEPEAFLHPPQARLLGKMLSKNLPNERQLFLATHSIDFLKGLLDSNISNLKVIRIQRDGQINKVSILDNSDITQIWKDSLLRHSNILNGLFHKNVIICESDSDCRFYSAILYSQYEAAETISPDVLFIHCGGKHRMSVAIKALKKLNVPLKVVPDFDVLNDINPLKGIFEDLGGLWSEVENDWKIMKKSIDNKKPELLVSEVKKELDDIFLQTVENILSQEKIRQVQKILKRASAWALAKELGKAFIPNGDAIQAFERIQIKFKEKGLYILEVGELESFVKSVGNHGPKWISEVLTKDFNDPEFENAKRFVNQLI